MSAPVPQETRESSTTGRPWWQALSRTDLIHIALVLSFLLKERLALSMIGVAPGPANMIATLGMVLCLTAGVRLVAGRWQTALWLLLSTVVSILLWSDVIYFRQFGDLVSVAALRQAHQLSTVSDSVAVLIQPGDWKLFLDIPILGALLFLPKGAVKRWFRPIYWPAVLGVAMSGVVLITAVATADPVLKYKWGGHSNVSSRLGLLNYHAFDVKDYTSRSLARLKPQDTWIKLAQDWFTEKRTAEAQPVMKPGAELVGSAKGKNVIMLQLEAFHSFPLGLVWEGQEITPNLNRLMQESLFFPDFYYQTGQGVTSDADLLGNCSLFPTRTGAVYYDYAHNNYRCTPTLLREHGYKAVAMQGIRADFWNLAAVYPQIGFETYYSLKDYNYDEQVGMSLSDESFLRQSIDKLKSLPEPYYSFMVTLTSHGPFWFSNLPTTLELGSLSGTKTGNYLNAVHYTDMAIGKFIDQMKAEGLLDDAVLVVYGDHYGVTRNDAGMPELLGLSMEDEVGWTKVEKQVPLLIRLPHGEGAGEYQGAAGQADIAPTVAGLIGVPTDDVLFMGRNLLQTENGVVPFYRGSAVNDTHLFLSPDDASGDGLCYELASGGQTSLAQCELLRDQAAKQLQISRLLVERDLIPAVLKRD